MTEDSHTFVFLTLALGNLLLINILLFLLIRIEQRRDRALLDP